MCLLHENVEAFLTPLKNESVEAFLTSHRQTCRKVSKPGSPSELAPVSYDLPKSRKHQKTYIRTVAQSDPLRKHAYSNTLKILPQKNGNFSDKNSDNFQISAQNIDCGYSFEPPRRGGSNEYLQSMFLSRNKKNNVYPCKPQFYYIKVGFNGVKII